MKARVLGQTNIAVSPLGLGLVKIGRNTGVKYPAKFDLPSDDQVKSLLALASELGINFLDTAPAYGSSEERLGKLLGSQRSDWVICSKAGEDFDGIDSSYCFTEAHIIYSVERTLKRLKTDVIDILLIHSNGDDINIIEKYDVFATLDRLKKDGKIRASGMSTKTIEGGKLAIDHSDCAMVTYNLNEQAEGEVIDYAHEQGKGILIKKGFASGHAGNIEDSVKLIFNRPGVTSLIAGTINPSHLAENAQMVAGFAG